MIHRSLLRFSKDSFASFTVEKREVSSAKNLTLIDQRNSVPIIETWGTPAFTGFHSEV